jgi:hypothetical protein
VAADGILYPPPRLLHTQFLSRRMDRVSPPLSIILLVGKILSGSDPEQPEESNSDDSNYDFGTIR